MIQLTAGVFLLATLVAMGCTVGAAPVSSRPVPEAVSLFAGLDCGGEADEPGAQWIGDEAGYKVVLEKNMSWQAGGESVDFSRHGVLSIHMGFKATAGFSLGLASGKVTLDNGTATVRITWNEPPPGALVPQMLTSPCMLVRLPKAGFAKVRVVDQDDRQRMIVDIK